MTTNLAVVIPYFQRQTGILSKAVASAFAQKNCPDFDIYIVDDGSPVPPAQDIAAFDASRIHVIRQQNKGCGAARNAALDCLPGNVEYVALLDSDDTWTEMHLSHAVFALDRGYDFYFSNQYQLGQSVGAFERDHRLDLRQHRKLDGAETVYEFCGDMYDQVLKKNLLGVPTNVYNFAKHRAIRFREGFRSLGEEYCFWLDISLRGATFAFSTDCELHCGSGVNVYAGAEWGSSKSLVRTHDEILFWKLVTHEYPLNDDQRAHLAGKIGRLRTELVLELFHQALSRRPVPPWLLFQHFRHDPQTLLRVVPAAIQSARGKLRGQRADGARPQ